MKFSFNLVNYIYKKDKINENDENLINFSFR